MSGRANALDPAQQLEIGRAVLAARAANVPWKTLERSLGRGRMQLWRYAAAAQAADDTKKIADDTSALLRADGACLI